MASVATLGGQLGSGDRVGAGNSSGLSTLQGVAGVQGSAIQGTAASEGRRPSDTGVDASSTPSRPVERFSRLSSFKNRLSPSPRDEPDTPTASHAGFPRRPRFKRRFSRSLTSLQASLLFNGDGPADSPGADGSDDLGTLAKWRAKGKAKLVGAFNKSSPPESPPTSPPASSSPFAPDLGRASSRSRSHSAPLFLPRAPPGTIVEAQGLLSSVAPPQEAATIAWPVPLVPFVRSHVEEPCDMEGLSPFTTCPSSPVGNLPADAFVAPCATPAPPRPPPNYFAQLPREVRVAVFRAVIEVCEERWRKEVEEGKWVGKRAGERWSDGRVSGRREVIKLGRVCKDWRALSLDGQLWSVAPATSLLGGDTFTQEGLAALMSHTGSFVTTLDARGLGESLTGKAVESLLGTSTTRLTKIDLTGCTSVTPEGLYRLIAQSPDLEDLVVPGLACVTGEHLWAITVNCPRLARLDVTRCRNLTAHWLWPLPCPPPRFQGSPAVLSAEQCGLKRLKASGIAGTDLVDLGMLLHWHPALATLDLSFCVGVDDALLDRMVSLPRSWTSSGPSQVDGVLSSPLSVPRPALQKHIFPALRHLNLSGCNFVTSTGLDHLAGALPNLEILELSRIDSNLRTGGLARVLASCPNLRKLDLEDATEVTDEVLMVLVPGWGGSTGAPDLTHLVIASCKSFTDAAIAAVALEGGCTKLRVLEADGTAISDRTAKAFVRLAGERARAAQAAARARYGAEDPLVASKYPGVLSLLDNRNTGRRLSRDVGWSTLRPRNGQRGYWTRAVEWYHDVEPDTDGALPTERERERAKGGLDECDPERVVVRSFYSNLAVDAARAVRDANEEKERGKASGGGSAGAGRDALLRTRAMSDSQIVRHTRGPDDEDGRVACVIS